MSGARQATGTHRGKLKIFPPPAGAPRAGGVSGGGARAVRLQPASHRGADTSGTSAEAAASAPSGAIVRRRAPIDIGQPSSETDRVGVVEAATRLGVRIRDPARFQAGSLDAAALQGAGAPADVVASVRDGVHLVGKDGGRVRLPGRPPPSPYNTTPAQAAYLLDQLQRMANMGVARRVGRHDCRIFHNILAVPKKQDSPDEYRFVVDARALNELLAHLPFTLPQAEDVVTLLHPGDVVIVIDYRRGFDQLRLREADRDLLGVVAPDGSLWAIDTAAMGISQSPYRFCRVTQSVVDILGRRGHDGLVYVDDSIYRFSSLEDYRRRAPEIVAFHEEIGAYLSESSVLEARSKFQFIGFEFDTVNNWWRVPDAKIAKAVQLLNAMLKQRSVSLDLVARVTGMICAMAPALRCQLVLLRAFYDAITPALTTGKSLKRVAFRRTTSTVRWARWWVTWLARVNGRQMWPSAARRAYSDASAAGFGATRQSTTGADPREAGGVEDAVYGVWDESGASINVSELRAIEVGLDALGFADERILWGTDSVSAAAYINRGGQVRHLQEVAERVTIKAVRRNVDLRAVHVPGEQLVVVDALSRRAHQRALGGRTDDVWTRTRARQVSSSRY